MGFPRSRSIRDEGEADDTVANRADGQPALVAGQGERGGGKSGERGPLDAENDR